MTGVGQQPHPRVPGFRGRVLDDAGYPAGTCFQVAPTVLVTACHVLAGLEKAVAGAIVRIDPPDREWRKSVFEGMHWMNEPPRWSWEGGTLAATTGHKTDFWRETFYDFVRDDGHFFYKDVTGDFTARVTLAGGYETLYDQSGLMLRVDQNNWVKTGIEFTDGIAHLSAVFTRDYSDWSVVPVPEYSGEFTLRLTRHGTAVRIEFLSDGGSWRLLRLGYLPIPETCQIGLMCCSPEREGFEARFKNFSISEPISRDLHA